MKKVHLICNAHLDIVWAWQEPEAMAEAISTFRIAADFCDDYDGFIFCHNEAILYEWIERHDPALFQRIQKLVAAGKWNIIGGWYLQPDCSMPSGEGIYRQIARGRRYFQEKFGKAPTTAINFDSFGHSRGLVQILRNNGYDSYIFGRPMEDWMDLEEEDFWWIGYDGSRICAHRSYELYHSLHGEAVKKIQGYLDRNYSAQTGLVLWGIGNHGGGPSRLDWKEISEMHPEGVTLFHSTPEQFFAELDKSALPELRRSLHPIFPGGYTSQCRVKQRYRMLENQLFLTEKMASHAALTCGMPYPAQQLDDAVEDLLTVQFHDYLPGTTGAAVEEDALRRMDHALEILRRVRDDAFFTLANLQAPALPDTIPVFFYNPHPYPVSGIFTCEVQLANQNWSVDTVTEMRVYHNGKQCRAQMEKESLNLTLDWRKRVTFEAVLEPFCMNRFDCQPVLVDKLPRERPCVKQVVGERVHFGFHEESGWPELLEIDGKQMLTGQLRLAVYQTDEDPWNSNSKGYGTCLGEFKIAEPLRVIEDGDVRTVVEGVYQYGRSRAIVRYRIPKHMQNVELEAQVDWQEPSCVLKWMIPSVSSDTDCYMGDDMFGTSTLQQNGEEMVSQRWCAVPGGLAILNNGIYGSSCIGGEVGLSLIQSSVYTALTLPDRPIVIHDRQLPYIDMGTRCFTIWLCPYEEGVFRQAEICNQQPYGLSFFAAGEGADQQPMITLDRENVQLSAFYWDTDHYVIRLFESAGRETSCTISMPSLQIHAQVELSAHAICTLALRKTGHSYDIVPA